MKKKTLLDRVNGQRVYPGVNRFHLTTQKYNFELKFLSLSIFSSKKKKFQFQKKKKFQFQNISV